MKYVFTALLAVGALVFLAAPATADWKEGDPDKMHFPQLPDPVGWDVKFGPFQDAPGAPGGIKVLADDWQCTETGPVSDIHFWFSVKHDEWNPQIPIPIQKIHVSIHDNKPADPEIPFSRPGALLWERDFGPEEFTAIYPWGTGQQGWYDPNTGQWNRPDHNLFGQVNINIPATAARPPFEQKRGEIYWLDLYMVADPAGTLPLELGWKTANTRLYPEPYTGKHFMDDAVWADVPATGEPTLWRPLIDPLSGQSLDMAFVITPEPGTVVMLIGAGLIGLVAYARRRRKG
jgi:hypothetical protein